MRPRHFVLSLLAAIVTGCGGPGEGAALQQTASFVAAPPSQNVSGLHSKIGLGKALSSAYGGQILGFDIDQTGSDGLLSESLTKSRGKARSAIETFDLKAGKITTVVKTMAKTANDDFLTFGIVGNDVGFVDEQRVKLNDISRHDRYLLLNPVQGDKITGQWEPPHVTDSVLYQQAENQATNTQVSVVFRNAFSQNVPWLYVWDSSSNRFLNFIRLSYTGSAMAEDSSRNQAVLASQSGSGAPIMTLVNLKTKKITVFQGLNNGPEGAGAVNGLAVDSGTGTACTTTELNAQVEFYDLAKETGFAVQLPGTDSGDQSNSGGAVANDSQNHLFLVAQPFSSESRGSSIYVYDESGNLVESINGFSFSGSSLPATKIAVNPGLRIGWVNGPGSNQIQQFFY